MSSPYTNNVLFLLQNWLIHCDLEILYHRDSWWENLRNNSINICFWISFLKEHPIISRLAGPLHFKATYPDLVWIALWQSLEDIKRIRKRLHISLKFLVLIKIKIWLFQIDSDDIMIVLYCSQGIIYWTLFRAPCHPPLLRIICQNNV